MQVTDIIRKKQKKERISALTAYDYCTALILNEAKVDVVLVGDSLGEMMLGYENTLPVTMDEMIHHTKAVSRASGYSLVIGDMPFMSDNISVSDTVYNAGRLIKEAGAGAVKLEGGQEITHKVTELKRSGIPVMGHIGLTPQDILVLGGYKRPKNEKKLIEDAGALESAGVFSIVLECVSEDIAKKITETVNIPTIGIGSGSFCDGDIMVIHDLLGLYPEKKPKYVKGDADLKSKILEIVRNWKDENNT